jgi:hypothetical protein
MTLRALDRNELFGTHQREARQHGQEADRVEGEANADAEGGDDHARHRRPHYARSVEEAGIERDGVRELLPPDHLEGEGVAPRGVEDERRSRCGGEHVREPNDLGAGEGEHRERGGDRH